MIKPDDVTELYSDEELKTIAEIERGLNEALKNGGPVEMEPVELSKPWREVIRRAIDNGWHVHYASRHRLLTIKHPRLAIPATVFE